MMNNRYIILLLFLPLLISCSRSKERTITDKEYKQAQDALVNVNRTMVEKDKERITAYIKENNLDLKESGTGLWYGITGKGAGKHVEDGMNVTLEYTVLLLDGTVCYSSDLTGYKQFIIGKGNVESGLDEGSRLLTEGDEATFILPPHLAHGLTGDGDRIPARAIIIYHVKLLKVD